MSKIYTYIRHITVLCVLFLLATGNAQAQYSGTGVFTKITTLAELTDGYYVVAYTTTQAMSSSRSGNVTTGYYLNTAISPVANVITNPPAAIVWKIETNGSGRTIYSETISSYVGWSSGNAASAEAAVANSNRWTVALSAGEFVFSNVATTTRMLQYNTSSPRFACYISSSNQQDLTLYKMPSTFYWDVSTAAGLGGSATWGTTFTNAVAGNTILVTAPITAQTIFQGTAGTVGLTAATTEAASLSFNVGGYVISTVSAGAKVLNGDVNLTTNNITFSPMAGSTLTVNDVISGTTAAANTALTKTGAGNLLFPGAANTFTGKLVINQGYIGISGESRFGANPGSFTANQITLNGGGILASGGAINFSSNRGITLGAGGGLFDATGGTITLTNVVTGTGSLTATAGTVLLGGVHTYTGNTIVNAGTLQLGINNAIADASNVVLGGGTFRTGATTGFSDVVGTLNLSANSTVTLGTGVHTLRFNNSSATTWAGTALSITGWSGVAGGSGTAGRIYVGTDETGLTEDQLAKITFNGFTAGAILRADGELVPAIPAGTITLSPATQALGSYCNAIANTISLTYTITGTVTDPFVELSSAAGSFAGATTNLGGTVSGSGTFTITATLPAGTAAGTAYRVRLKSTNSTPVISANNNSNIIITAAVTPTVTIAASPAGAVCAGNNITFTATPANLGGGSVNTTTGYQWKIGGVDVAGQTANTFTTNTLTNGEQVSCVISITGGCVSNANPASNTITANITTPVTPTVTIMQTSGTNPLCVGASGTFTATPATLGGGTVAANAYQWKINGGNVAGQTAATFTTTILADGDLVSCAITVTGGCITTNTAQSANITMSVTALPLAPTGTITANANPSCGPAILTYNNSTPEAGVTYYWQTTAAGTSTTINAGTTNYSVATTTANIYVRGRNANGCWGPAISSGLITINTVVSTSNPANQNVIAGANATFTTVASGTGPFTYQWQVNTGSGFGDIVNGGVYSGAATASLAITGATLAMTGYTYQVVVTGTCGTATSGIATLTVSTLNIPVVVNEIFTAPFNTGKSYVELLVLQNNLDMRGWIVRDYNPSGNDGAGGWGSFQFASTTAWQSVPAGTLITVLSSGYAAADEDIDISDGILALKANNTTYPINYTFSSTSPPSPQGFAFSPTTDAAIISNASGVAQHGLGYFNNTNPSEVPQLAAAPYWSSYDLGSAVTSSTTLGATIRFVNTASVADFDLGENNTKVAFVQGATPATIELPNDAAQTTFIAAQRNAVDFRSRASGNYYDRYAPWEANNGTGWAITGGVPSSLYRSVEIRNGHTISYPAVTVQEPKIDQVVVRSGGTLANTSTSGLKISNGSGTDLLVEGTYIDNGSTSAPIVFDAGATWALGATGTIVKTGGSAAVPYRDNYEGGMSTIPENANWIIRQTSGDVSFTTINTFYPNLTFEKTNAGMWAPAVGSSRFTGNSTSATIKGGLDIGGTGTGNVTVYDENYHPNPLLINGNLRVRTGSILTNAGTTEIGTGVEVKGDIIVDGTLTLNTNGKGLLKLSGTTDQNISGTGAENLNAWDLRFANAGRVVIPNRNMNVFGRLYFENNSGVRFGTGDVVIKSTATNTANVAPIGTAILDYSGSGRFIVERYIPTNAHGRAWQLLSTPTTGTQTIREAWQENNAPMANAKAGFGTLIYSTYGTAGGFDNTGASANLKRYLPLVDQWDNGPASTSETIHDPKGYMLFVRGDRASTQAHNNPAAATVLRTRGQLYAPGNLPGEVVTEAGKYQSVGNPYAASIDIRALLKTNLTDEIYIWDPTLGGSFGFGKYRTLTVVGSDYEITPTGGAYPDDIVNRLQSGQAFFIKAQTGLVGKIAFSEAAKTDSSRLVNRGGNGEEAELLKINLFEKASVSNTILLDGAMAIFGHYSRSYDNNDGQKIPGTNENSSFRIGNSLAAVERRPSPQANDTLHLELTGTRQVNYQWQLDTRNMMLPGRTAWVYDRFLELRTPIDLNGQTLVDFTVTADAASSARDRFKIVFNREVAAPTPVTFISVTATRNADRSIHIQWKVENEVNITGYTIERSADGQHFSGILTTNTTGLSTYDKDDLAPLVADNYYRIKAIGLGGEITYSNIVKVAPIMLPSSISIAPNPVENKVAQLRFMNQPAGNYQVKIINKAGQVIYHQQVKVTGNNFLKKIELGNIASGGYSVLTVNERGELVNQEILVK
jgi:autotransporter-associated beta strand protein